MPNLQNAPPRSNAPMDKRYSAEGSVIGDSNFSPSEYQFGQEIRNTNALIEDSNNVSNSFKVGNIEFYL
jgi:hypothetical protein